MKIVFLTLFLIPIIAHGISRAPAVIEEPIEYAEPDEPEDRYWEVDEDLENKRLELLEKKQIEIISDELGLLSEE